MESNASDSIYFSSAFQPCESPFQACTSAKPARMRSSGKPSPMNTITLSRDSPSAHSLSQSKP